MPQRPSTAKFRKGVGATIRSRREMAGWSKKELAARAGVTPQMISGYEFGNKMPSCYTLIWLMDKFSLTAGELTMCL